MRLISKKNKGSLFHGYVLNLIDVNVAFLCYFQLNLETEVLTVSHSCSMYWMQWKEKGLSSGLSGCDLQFRGLMNLPYTM